MNEHGKSLKKLAQTLESCGAAPRRWPDDDRAALQALIRANPEARALLHEARALEQLLDTAPPVEGIRELESRILGSIDDVAARPAGDNLISFPRRAAPAQDRAGRWGVAAVLAASLLVGIWVGAGGYATSLVDAPLEAAGLDMGNQVSSYYVSGISAEEDLL
jgi:hypothetical protein